MDEQEQADRLAAAEALYMISTRGDKSNTIQKSPRLNRKKRNNDHDEESSRKRKAVMGDGDRAGGGRSRDQSRSSSGGSGRRGAGGSRASGGSTRGRGGRGPGSRGRGTAGKGGDPLKSQQRQTETVVSAAVINYENLKGHNNNGRYNKHNITVGENILPQHHGEDLKQKSKTRTPKVRQKTKIIPPPIDKDDYSQRQEGDDGKVKVHHHHHQAIGFTGAAISLRDSLPKRSSYDSSQALQSHGLVSGFKQVTLTSQTLSSAEPVFSLSSMNLPSFAPDVNLPSIPLEIGSLQLSSQPTPNLSSLGDLSQGALEDAFSFANRKKAEKFLPLKKRKLHNPSEPEAREEASAVEASPLSDSEERSELQSSPPPIIEPLRASFTVQAPPIITMQTLMEIKTALTADDDGDLPLHIAVVHENMRMVIKLITLMKIAGKGVDKFNKQQQTPLHLAVKLNFLEAVDILLKSSANVNAVDCTGSSCIHMAVQGKSTDCLTMLLERCPNADLNARNFDGLTPLHIAVDNGDLQQVEVLLKYNADIDVTDGKSGRTALFWAAESNQKAMVELLLGKGANPDVPNYAGVTTAMAAQGRNLHGVLKLLGSVATEKFTEFDMKPNLESKPSPLYLGLPSSDSLALSHHSAARSISLSKLTGPGLTCLVEPKMGMDTLGIPSDETKVFKNVFVLSQNQAKSMSEPSSPEVKMEVTEDKDDETYGRSGLMSLPEGIFGKTEEDRGHVGSQRKMVVTGLGGSLFTTRGKMQSPALNSTVVKIAEPGVQRSEQKSVFLHVVPSFSAVGASAVTASASSSNITRSASSNPSSEFGVSLSKPTSVTSSVSSSTSSATSPLSHLSSSNDTVTLTNMQARLFQLLLKKYNIDPSSEAATSSSDSRLLSTTLSIASPKWTSFPAPSPLTSALSATASYQEQRTQSHTMQGVQISRGSYEPNLEQETECNGSSKSFHPQTAAYQHERVTVLGNNHSRISENGTDMETEESKPAESPLNLSTTSSRQDVGDSRSMTPSKGTEGPVSARHPVYSSQSSSDGGSSMVMTMNPAQLGSLGKVISFDVHRAFEHTRSGQVGNDSANQFEMFLLPEGQAQIPVTVAPGHIASSGVATLLRAQSVPQLKPAAKQSEQKPVAEAASDSSHITSVSQKTAFIVRDYLTQQKHHTFSSQPVSAVASLSSVQASVPTVLDLAADNSSSSQMKHVIALARNPSAVVSLGKTASYASPSVSSTLLLPPASTSPVFLHQGHVIDLSRSKGQEANCVTSSQSLTLSSGSSDAGQGKIIGFSGAVISVVPSKLEQLEKRPPRETTPKEFLKKRGRKSQKPLPGLTLAAESGLGKINSETDEKLKKFLDAKKSEISFSALSCAVDAMLGLQDEHVDGIEDDMEDSEVCKVTSALEHSEGRIDKTYKTVGIFSGNIQHVKVGKKPAVLTSVVPTLPTALLLPVSSSLTSSPTLLASHDSKSMHVDVSEVKSRKENIGFTSPAFVPPCVAPETSKHYIKMASIETDMSDTLDCEKNVSDDVSNYSSGCSDVKSKSVGTRLPADASTSTSRKSKKRTKKSPSSCVKGRAGAFQSKKEARMQQSCSESDSISSSSFVSEQTQKLECSEMKSKAVPVKMKGKIHCRVKAKETNVSTKTSLEAAKRQEIDSGVCDSSQNLPPNGDSFSKHKKRQGRKRLGLQGKEQVSKSVPVVTSEQDQTSSTCDSNIRGLTSGASVTSDGHNVFSAELSDRSSERAHVVCTADDDDDDFGDEPALVIEETQQEMS